MKLYALHDKKAKSLSSFHVERSDTVASRGFAEAVTAPNSTFGKYAEDFELVALCDVSQDYEDVESLKWMNFVEPFLMTVVITAKQVLDMQPKADGQLSLLKEA